MERVFRRHGALVILAAALALSVWVVNWARTPELTQQYFPEDHVEVPRDNWRFGGSKPMPEIVDEDEAAAGAEAAGAKNTYILLEGLEGELQSIYVRLGSEPARNGRLTVYYPDVSGEFAQELQVSDAAYPGKMEYMLNLQFREYTCLGLELPGEAELSAVYVSGSPVEKEAHIIPPFRLSSLMAFFVIILALIEAIAHWRAWIAERLRALWGARRPLILGAVGLMLAGAALALLAWPVCRLRGIPYLWHHRMFFMLLGAMVWGLWLLRGQAAEHPQRVFALLCLTLGLIFIMAAPFTGFITGDGGIHYRQALGLSYGGRAYVTKADVQMMWLSDLPVYTRTDLYRELYWDIKANYDSGAVYILNEGIVSPAYIPGAVGLWLGRFFGREFEEIYTIGRFMNLLAYTLLVCLAVKLARRGKILLCVVGLVPSAVFQAATYSTGGIMTALAMLAAVLIFRAPRCGAKNRLISAGLCAALALSVLAGPAASILGGGAQTAASQGAHIMSNPLAFVKTLIKFVVRDLASPSFLTDLGNLSNLVVHVPGSILILAALGVTAITEPEAGTLQDNGTLKLKLGLGAELCAAAGLLAIGAYLLLTPVGAGSVEGFQGRWLLPMLFPALYLLRAPQIRSSFHRGRYLYAMLCPAVVLTCIQMWRIIRCFR